MTQNQFFLNFHLLSKIGMQSQAGRELNLKR